MSYTRVWNPSIISETASAISRLVTARPGANPNTDSIQSVRNRRLRSDGR